jgi:hypothetical protein
MPPTKLLVASNALKLPPLHPEDRLPTNFDRRALERRIAREATLALKSVER